MTTQRNYLKSLKKVPPKIDTRAKTSLKNGNQRKLISCKKGPILRCSKIVTRANQVHVVEHFT